MQSWRHLMILAWFGALSAAAGCSILVNELPDQDAAADAAPALDGYFAADTPPGDGPLGDGLVPGDVAGEAEVPGKFEECEISSHCPVLEPHCAPTGLCVECIADIHCPGERCVGGYCMALTCIPGSTQCKEDKVLTCGDDGLSWTLSPCASGVCTAGACDGCPPDLLVCEFQTILHCKEDGSAYEVVGECGAAEYCVSGLCLPCYPGTQKCAGNLVQMCDLAGGWVVTDDCGAIGKACTYGFCVSSCFDDFKSQTNSGCDYWAVDLDNHWDAQDSPYAVVVSNLSSKPSIVSVSRRDGADEDTVEVDVELVAPGGVKTFPLPARHPGDAGVFWATYRVQATAPIIAYQFNPLDNVDVFSNDATLLLPATTFAKEYLVMSWPQLEGEGALPGTLAAYRGTATIVAIEPDTAVTIVPTTQTLPGQGLPALFPGEPHTVVIQPYQVINLMTDSPGGDLTGTQVTSDKPIGVYGGHISANTSDRCCTDHLEHQLYPVGTWGKEVVAARSAVRDQEADYWRVLASENDTVVSFQPGPEPQTLQRGQVFDLTSKEDFLITADKPILVAQVLASAQEVLTVPQLAACESGDGCHDGYSCKFIDFSKLGCFPPSCASAGASCSLAGHTCACFDPVTCACQPVGDPALILVPPVAQWRIETIFLTPDSYTSNYISVVASDIATVTLDDAVVPEDAFSAIGASGYKAARLPVGSGPHHLVATSPVAVLAYGFDKDVSYGFAAGLNLSDL